MKKAPFALKSPFWLHGFLYVLAAHLTGYIAAVLFYALSPTDWEYPGYIPATVFCALSLPLFLRWFFRNENPIGYLVTTVISHIVCGLAGVALIYPMLVVTKVLTDDPLKLEPWAFIVFWLAVALFFGALLLVLCLGLLVYALIRRRLSPATQTAPETAPSATDSETAPDPIPDTTTDT